MTTSIEGKREPLVLDYGTQSGSPLNNIYGDRLLAGTGWAGSLVPADWGFAGPVEVTALALGRICESFSSGVRMSRNVLPFSERRPPAGHSELFASYSFSIMLHWPVPIVALESGAFMGMWGDNQTVRRPVSVGADNALGVYNDNGTLKFMSRGVNGAETVSLAAYQNPPATEWNAIKITVNFATSSRDAELLVDLNGVRAITRPWTGAHKLPGNEAPVVAQANWGFGMRAWLAQNSATPMYAYGTRQTWLSEIVP